MSTQPTCEGCHWFELGYNQPDIDNPNAPPEIQVRQFSGLCERYPTRVPRDGWQRACGEFQPARGTVTLEINPDPQPKTWPCPECGFDNPLGHLRCQECGRVPGVSSDGNNEAQEK